MRRTLGTASLAASLLMVLVPHVGHAEVTILAEEHVVEMSDGVRLFAAVGRPDDALDHPVLITGTPYGGEPAGAAGLAEPYEGDVVVVSFHLRGSGASEGVFDVWGPRTRADAVEMVDWAANAEWSNGEIITFGGSGLAPWQYEPLSQHHPAVKAAMVATTCIDFYRDCFHPGGTSGPVIEAAGGLIVAGYVQAMEARQRLGLAANPSPVEQLAGMAAELAQGTIRDLDSPYWRVRAATEEVKDWNVPVLFFDGPYDIGGWNGVIEAYLRAPNGYLSLNGGHSAPVQLREEYDGPLQTLFVREVLFGEDKGVLGGPRVRLFTGLGSRISWSKGEMLFRTEASYPLPSTRWTKLYLDQGRTGSAVSLNDGALTLEPGADGSDVAPVTNTAGPKTEMRLALQIGSIPPLIRQGLSNNLPPEVINLADNALIVSDMRPEEASAVTFTSPLLTQNVEISGEVVARLFATSTLPDLDVVVRLTDVWPDGRSEWITDTRLRASMRRVDPAGSRYTAGGDAWRPWLTYDGRQPLIPGDVNEFLLHMQNTSMVFRAGHRIRLDVFTSGQAGFDATPAPGAFTILRGPQFPSSILLPVIPEGCNASVPAFEGIVHPGPCALSLADALE